VKQNANLQGQADAAQRQGFDPAFVSLVTLPAVLDMMAISIDDYAALGEAFKGNQASVMSAIQALRQQVYASGALDSNQYQKVSVEQQNGVQVVVVQPVNPQVVYVPQYQPQQVYVSGPSQSDVVAASLPSFGVGIAIGALINSNQPWSCSAWGLGWWRWRLAAFRYHVTVLWHRTLRRRSQKDWTSWDRITRLVATCLPPARILHPGPNVRFAVKHPRWEPGARIVPAGICAGGAQ